jgi:hypothetical protein
MGGVFNLVNMQMYHYAGNNPVKYVDPDGEIINIPDEKDRKQIEKMINSISRDKYAINSSGDLYRLGNEKNGVFGVNRSQSFSDQLEQGIESSSLIRIGIDDKIVDGSNKIQDVHERYGGGVTANTVTQVGDVSIRSSEVTVTGKESAKRIPLKNGKITSDSAAQTLMHELTVHAIPHINSTPASLRNENSVRREMGWKERAPDAYHTE